MKTKPADALRNLWLTLTEVPGWPDAPFWPRLRRASPVLLPCVLMTILGSWHFLIHAPRVTVERASLQPLIALEEEIASLQLACSEQQVVELAERATSAARLLLEAPEDVSAFLRGLKKEAGERGFEASFVSADSSSEASAEGAVVAYVPVRGKLTPRAGNTESFASLLTLLERFTSSGKRIDLMRVAIRADEQKWQAVEMNLRLVRRPVNEKTP